MNKSLVRAALGAWLLGSAAAVAMMAGPAVAASSSQPKASAAVGAPLNDALKAIVAKDYPTAQAAIAKARAVPTQTDVDKFKIEEVNVFLTLSMSDHASALASYRIIIASPLLTTLETPEQQQQTLKNALLLANEAKDTDTASKVATLMGTSGAPMDDVAMASLSSTYYNNKDYAKAHDMAQKSIDAAIAAGKKPNSAALQILMNSYVNQNDQAGARKVLEQMVLYYNNPDFWAKEIDITIGSTKGVKDIQILQLYRLRVVTAATGDDNDYSIPADLAIKNGYPGEARSILQTGISRGISGGRMSQLLADARAKAAADEKTLPANDAAGAKSPNGTLDTLVAEQYYGYGRYAEAEATARRAIGKGGAKDPEEPKMVLGMAQVAQGKFADAIATFNTVGGSDSQKKIAHVWILYAQNRSQPDAAAAPAPAKQ